MSLLITFINEKKGEKKQKRNQNETFLHMSYYENIFQYFLKKLQYRNSFHRCRYSLFEIKIIDACENGYIDTLKWMKETFELTNKYLFCIEDSFAFDLACRDGHLFILKWLHSTFLSTNDVDNYIAFQYACHNGHFFIVKWILKNKFVNLDMIVTDRICKVACKNGHLNVAKWLSSFFQLKHKKK